MLFRLFVQELASVAAVAPSIPAHVKLDISRGRHSLSFKLGDEDTERPCSGSRVSRGAMMMMIILTMAVVVADPTFRSRHTNATRSAERRC